MNAQAVHKCPIKSHEHDVVHVSEHTQQGTNAKGDTFECPTGRYRWFVLRGRALSDVTRMQRPRFGWRQT